MAEDAGLELQKAHIALLRGNAGLQALIGQKVYDYVARSTAYPYVRYFNEGSSEWDHSDSDGEIHLIQIHVFSDAEGSTEARKILRLAHDLIQGETALVLTDHNLVNCRRTGGDVFREGQVYHGVGLYRATTEETA